MINIKTRQLHNELCSIIRSYDLPPVNIELVLNLILRDATEMTNAEILNESNPAATIKEQEDEQDDSTRLESAPDNHS